MEAYLIIALALLCTGLPWWLGQRYGLLPFASPMHVLAYFVFFGFAVKVVAYAIAPDLAFYRHFARGPWAMQSGALYLSGSILLMCLGYRLSVRPVVLTLQTQAVRQTTTRFQNLPLLMLAAALLCLLTLWLMLQARGVTSLSLATLQALNNAKQIAVNADGVGATLAGIKTLFIVPKLVYVMMLARAVVRPDRVTISGALFMAAVLVMIALVSGDRFELVELMLMTAATYGIAGGRLQLSTLALGAVGFIGLFAVSSYMTALRGADGGLWVQMVGSTYFLDINAAAMVTDRVTPPMYLMGDSYLWWSFGWVPRAIWPDKPAIDLGVFFKSVVLDQPGGGAFNVTGPGEAFINFGWAGMAVGFVLGCTYRWLEVWLLEPARSLRWASFLFYPLILLPFVQATLQSSFSAFIVGATAQVFVVLAVILAAVPLYRRKTWKGAHHAV